MVAKSILIVRQVYPPVPLLGQIRPEILQENKSDRTEHLSFK